MGGRNIRRTSSIHFAENCLIDFPTEIFSQAERFGIDLIQSRLLLVTHSHEDHFYPHFMHWRYRAKEAEKMTEVERFLKGMPRQQDLPVLHIFGNSSTYNRLISNLDNVPIEDCAIEFTIPELYREYECGGVRFIPMAASHIDRGSELGLIYIVEAEGKTFLYATDSGPYTEKTRECIAAHKYDAVIMEQTFGYAKKGNFHMDWKHAMEAADFFERKNVWKNSPRIYWTHMSPHRTPPHEDLEKLLTDTDILPAYDGMKIEL